MSALFAQQVPPDLRLVFFGSLGFLVALICGLLLLGSRLRAQAPRRRKQTSPDTRAGPPPPANSSPAAPPADARFARWDQIETVSLHTTRGGRYRLRLATDRRLLRRGESSNVVDAQVSLTGEQAKRLWQLIDAWRQGSGRAPLGAGDNGPSVGE